MCCCEGLKEFNEYFLFLCNRQDALLLTQMVSVTHMASHSSLKIMIVKMTEMCSSPMSKNPRQNNILGIQVLKYSRNQFVWSGYLQKGLCLPIFFQTGQVWLQHNLHTHRVRHHIALPQQDQNTYHAVRTFSSFNWKAVWRKILIIKKCLHPMFCT